MNLVQLPDCILLRILTYVPHSDLLNLCYASHKSIPSRLSLLSRDKSLWTNIVLTRTYQRANLKRVIPLLHSKTKDIFLAGSHKCPSISEYFLESIRRHCQSLEYLCLKDVVLDAQTAFIRALSIKSLQKIHLINVKIINLPTIRSHYSSPFRNFFRLLPKLQELKLAEAPWLHKSDIDHIKKSKNVNLIIEKASSKKRKSN